MSNYFGSILDVESNHSYQINVEEKIVVGGTYVPPLRAHTQVRPYVLLSETTQIFAFCGGYHRVMRRAHPTVLSGYFYRYNDL